MKTEPTPAFETELAGFPIRLEQGVGGGKRFRVTYGQQIDSGLSYGNACKKLGEAILHALACEGKIENDGP